MKKNLNLVTPLHQKTKRNYLARVTEYDKAECAGVAKKFGADYWDGDRRYGYGGYRYDGRWGAVAKGLIEQYHLGPGSKVLDVGCGKGFLLFELKKLIPEIEVRGIDISEYAIENAIPEIRSYLEIGNANRLNFPDHSFDLVISLTTLHNLYLFDLFSALKEMQRISKGNSYFMTESYRNEREKVNLLYWQLTCEAFFTPTEWEWIFEQCGFQGDYEFIYFE